MDYKFQINLRGMIDLLSNHLYSGPQIYLRELLQNGIDALHARTKLDPTHEGQIDLTLGCESDGTPVLLFEDNGVGLTEQEIHEFLATIGHSSKRNDVQEQRKGFLGQFGIGLLSCFVVCDEIVVQTRSAREGQMTLQWLGRQDGTYRIETLDEEREPGTLIRLRCKPGCEPFFQPDKVRKLVFHYGELLQSPVYLHVGEQTFWLNEEPVPWRQNLAPDEEAQVYFRYGKRLFDLDFFDYIPLRSEAGQVEGVAFVLPFSPHFTSKRAHRVYLRNMLLSESAENLLPEWTLFVRCVVNADGLRPTASRESFYENETFFETQDTLGQQLRNYLLALQEQRPKHLKKLISLHYLSIKALALEDDEFYEQFIDWLPFETTFGEMTLSEYLQDSEEIRYVSQLNQFRQIAHVASAQGLCIINGSYTHDTDLLRKLPLLRPTLELSLVEASDISEKFEDLDWREQDEAQFFLDVAHDTLQTFGCAPEIKKFLPAELPTLYSNSPDSDFQRTVEQTKELTNALWSSVLDSLLVTEETALTSQLCFNHNHPLIQKLLGVENEELLAMSVQMLYVQALLLGHHPLSSQEMELLNIGLLDLLEWSIDRTGSGGWMS